MTKTSQTSTSTRAGKSSTGTLPRPRRAREGTGGSGLSSAADGTPTSAPPHSASSHTDASSPSESTIATVGSHARSIPVGSHPTSSSPGSHATERSEGVRVALWVRVSTTEQDWENQIPVLTEWAARRGLVITKTYTLQQSAFKDNAEYNAVLAQAQEDARHGEFDVLMIWALDRLSRHGVERTLAILRRFVQYGVGVWSYEEPWTETVGETRELLLSIFAWVAQQESKRRSERTKLGIARAKANGVPHGKRGPDKKPRKKSGYNARWENARAGTIRGQKVKEDGRTR